MWSIWSHDGRRLARTRHKMRLWVYGAHSAAWCTQPHPSTLPSPPLTCMLDDRPQGWPGAWPHCPLTWHTTSVTLRSSVSVHRPQHPASQDASSTRVGLTQIADWLPDTWPSYYQCYLLHETKWNPVIGIVDAHYSWVDYLERKFRRHISCNTWQP